MHLALLHKEQDRPIVNTEDQWITFATISVFLEHVFKTKGKDPLIYLNIFIQRT